MNRYHSSDLFYAVVLGGFLMVLIILCIGGCTRGETAIEPTLIRGRIPDKDDFKAVAWVGGCTGTAIGPRVITTAAHCVSDRISISIGKDKFTADCMVSKDYGDNKGSISSDYALCALDGDVGGPYEVVNFDEDHVKIGEEILLSGYGCQKWGGSIDGKFRIGEAKVEDLGKGNKDNYLIAGHGATLCSGDSGGPAWSLKPSGERNRLIGLNSRSDTKAVSYISYIAKPEGIRFFKAWSSRYPKLKICGLHSDAEDCLGLKPLTPPAPPSDPIEIDHEVAHLSVTMKPAYTSLQERLKRFLWEALELVSIK